MSQKLFPILADPNPPSSFDGLDVSLVAGQITALNGADSFNMTASTLTANGVSASWADIVDGVVNPPATPTLQQVLDANNTAIAQSIVLGDADPATATSSLSSSTFLMTGATATDKSTMNVSSFKIEDATKSVLLDNVQSEEIPNGLHFRNADTGIQTNYSYNLLQIQNYISGETPGESTAYHTTELNGYGLYLNLPSSSTYNPNFVNSRYTYTGLTSNDATHIVKCNSATGFTDEGVGALAGLKSSLDHDRLFMLNTNTAVNSVLNSLGLTVSSGGETASLSTTTLQMTGINPTETASLSTASLTIASANDTSILEDNKLRIRNSDASSFADLTRTGLNIANSGGANTEVKIGEVSSSANLSIDAGADLSLSAGSDTLTFQAGGMTSTFAGGSTDKYLVINVNGTPYKISLLALI